MDRLTAEPAARQAAEQQTNMVLDAVLITLARRRLDIEHLQVLVHQLIDRGPGARVALFVQLVQQAGAGEPRDVRGRCSPTGETT